MILKVFDAEQHEREHFLEIVERSDNCIIVKLVDSVGKPLSDGRLADFTPDGIILHENIDISYGFPLDGKGRLRVIE